jgi:hypothetical protein
LLVEGCAQFADRPGEALQLARRQWFTEPDADLVGERALRCGEQSSTGTSQLDRR